MLAANTAETIAHGVVGAQRHEPVVHYATRGVLRVFQKITRSLRFLLAHLAEQACAVDLWDLSQHVRSLFRVHCVEERNELGLGEFL